MRILLLAYLGGVLTILSPCILPMIPLVFARTGRSFAREIAPMLVGLALAFTAASSKTDQAAIAETIAAHGRGGFAAAWLRGKGLDWAADMLTSQATEVSS